VHPNTTRVCAHEVGGGAQCCDWLLTVVFNYPLPLTMLSCYRHWSAGQTRRLGRMGRPRGLGALVCHGGRRSSVNL